MSEFCVFSPDELRQLVGIRERACLSLYMPTHSAGRERLQDEIRLKNLVREAERQFKERGVESPESDELLTPIRQLPQDVDVWRQRGEALAAFSAPGFFRCYKPSLAGPELAKVNERFYVSPLLPLLRVNRGYFLLALTKEGAELFEAGQHSLIQQELPALEPILVDGTERPLQQHSHRAPSQGRGGTDEAIFHGQGGPDDREKSDIANFFKRQIDPAVCDALRGESLPLVLAGADYLCAIYRDVNSYPNLADEHVSGSPSELGEASLREQGWSVAAPVLRAKERKALEQYNRLAGSDRASTRIEAVTEAAWAGRAETLLVRTDVAMAPVTSARDDMQKQTSPLSEQIDEAIAQTILHEGDVLAVDDAPEGAMIAAIFRY